MCLGCLKRLNYKNELLRKFATIIDNCVLSNKTPPPPANTYKKTFRLCDAGLTALKRGEMCCLVAGKRTAVYRMKSLLKI